VVFPGLEKVKSSEKVLNIYFVLSLFGMFCLRN